MQEFWMINILKMITNVIYFPEKKSVNVSQIFYSNKKIIERAAMVSWKLEA